MLDQHEIHFHAMDSQLLGILPFYAQAVGGVKVQVLSSQWGKAQELLELIREDRPQNMQPIDEEDAEWMAERKAADARRESHGIWLGRVLTGTFVVVGIVVIVSLLFLSI